MKNILIFSQAMEIGGAERALLGLLENIDTAKYDVDLFLMRHDGELMRYIPGNIHLLPEMSEYACLAVPIGTVLKRHQFKIAYGRLKAKVKASRAVKRLELEGDNDVELEYSHRYTARYMPQISPKEYDLAISFLTPHYFVAQKVRAKRKIAWIHTDYSTVKVDRTSQLKMWDAYDHIASISDQVTESFLKIFPELKRKMVCIPNIMPMKYLKVQSEEPMPEKGIFREDSINLLSIGRYSPPKNFDSIPDICRRIRSKGLNVVWYLIGYGGEEGLIREKIQEAGMQDYVIMLGKKENPYPYIKACDLYVQPSRYEGKCVAVIEAQILHKPVVITRYPTSASQLRDGTDGVIVPMDNQGCAEGIAAVISNRTLRQRITDHTRHNDYSNKDSITIIENLLET